MWLLDKMLSRLIRHGSLIVTDYDDIELRRAASKAGASRYVIKEDLLSILEILTA